MKDNSLDFLWQQTFATLFATANKLQTKGDISLEHFTVRQLMLLIGILHLKKEEATLSNAARMIGSTKQSTKQIVDNLKSKSYLTAEKNPQDRRAVMLSVTEQGKKLLNEDFERGMKAFSLFFKGFSKEELTMFWGFLKRLYQFDGEEQLGYEK